jgi:hypothetical protein
MPTTVRDLLLETTLTRDLVDRFLDPQAHNFAKFDPVLGYALRNCLVRDGLDHCYTIYRYAPTGERRMIQFAEQPCRINSYGDSFTQCHQVSDGETWQEYLAAHLGEPIRNYGVGGYGVYQAYLRLLREEATSSGAEYIVLNIWSDDHARSLMRWRWLQVPGYRRAFFRHPPQGDEVSMFHINPWAHIAFDPSTRTFAEQPNPYPTPESLYLLCDPEHVLEAFRDDFAAQTMFAEEGATDLNRDLLRKVADALDLEVDFSSQEATARTARGLLAGCGQRASVFVLDRLVAYLRQRGKKLLVLLTYGAREVIEAARGRPRADQFLVDYLRSAGILYVDGLEKHVADYRSYACPVEEYVSRHYIGHYTPTGNHFFAFAIRNDVVAWLNPKPPAYREGGPSRQVLASALA